MVSATNPSPLPDGFLATPRRDDDAEAMLSQLYGHRVDELADAILRRLKLAIPQANDLDDQFVQDLMSKTRTTLRRALQVLSAGESFEQLGPLIEETARLRRSQQLTQEMIFYGYRYIQHVLFEEVSDGLRDHPQAQRLKDAVSLRQLEFQWVVSRRVAAAFDTGAEAHAASREESIQAVLEMLAGQRTGTANLEDAAAEFGLLLPLEHVAVSFATADTRPGTKDGINVRPIARANPWSVVGTLKGRVVILGRSTPWGLPAPWGSCSIPPEVLTKPELLAERIALASEAAGVASKLGLEHADADEVAPFISVSGMSPDRQEAFLETLFGDLHTSSRGLPILQAVAVSASSAGRREAARRLKVHPNTLDYRLARFRELTGINLADPIQRLRCDLGLYLLGLLGE